MPNSRASDVSAISIAADSTTSNSQSPALSDISAQDKPWDKHRAFADRVEDFYRGSSFHRYSQRIHDCSELLKFGLVSQEDTSLESPCITR